MSTENVVLPKQASNTRQNLQYLLLMMMVIVLTVSFVIMSKANIFNHTISSY